MSATRGGGEFARSADSPRVGGSAPARPAPEPLARPLGQGGRMALTTDSHGRHSALLEGEEFLFEGGGQTPRGPDYATIRSGAEFVLLRRRLRWFVFPMSALFMIWYMTFVLLAAYAHGFMSTPVLGLVNVGMLLGLAQFVSTVL